LSQQHKNPAKKLFNNSRGSAATKLAIPVYFQKKLKHNARAPAQLKFDLAVIKYLASCNLSFNHVNLPGFIEFIKFLDPKYHVKSSRTFSRAKLPLLYRLCKQSVTKKIQNDLSEDTLGVALTTDCWSSK
jgi:hypothetical protein